MKRILIVHGWMHSAARYEKLKKDLEKEGNCEVLLYEFPGFGATKAKYKKNIMEHYAEDMKIYLRENAFDMIIAHSLGGNIVLKALYRNESDLKLVLLSPEYAGIPLLKPMVILAPLVWLGLWLAKLPGKVSDFFIKLLALFTVNKWKDIDGQIITDVRRADVCVSTKLMFRLAYDSWRLPEDYQLQQKVLLCIGEKDRIILRSHMEWLKAELKNCEWKCFQGIGHTAVLEDYETLLKTIKEIKL